VFVKQLGAKPQCPNVNAEDWPETTTFVSSGEDGYAAGIAMLRDRKGGDPSEWPEDLSIREYPT
jgi:hypothetical protein